MASGADCAVGLWGLAMSGGFGRKGVGVGSPIDRGISSPVNPAPRFATAAIDADDGLSPEARAFIAAERARQPKEAQSADPMVSAAASAMRLSPGKRKSSRSMLIAYVLWWWGTPLAAHRFYLGAHRSAVAMLGLFWGGLAIAAMMSKQSSNWVGGYAVPPPGIMMVLIWMIWALLDAFLIPGMMKRYRAANRTDELTHVFA